MTGYVKKTKPCNNNKRLEWAGHIVRISDDRTIKNVFLAKTHRRIKAGRTKLWWLHCTENNWQSTRVNRLRKNEEDRSAWSIIVKETLLKLYGPCANEAVRNLYHKSNL
jgi:predicted acetyltransferase